MIANMKAFGYMDEQDANSELKRKEGCRAIIESDRFINE